MCISSIASAPGGQQPPPLIYHQPYSQDDACLVKSNDTVWALHVLGKHSPLGTILSPFSILSRDVISLSSLAGVKPPTSASQVARVRDASHHTQPKSNNVVDKRLVRFFCFVLFSVKSQVVTILQLCGSYRNCYSLGSALRARKEL